MSSARTVWRVVGVPIGVFLPELGRAGLEVSVESVDPAVIEAIEQAAERAGVELERVSGLRLETSV